MRKVVKFGGTSLADSSQFRKVRDIVLEDEARTIVIPSAPGRRSANDLKVTDLLYQCYGLAAEGKDFRRPLQAVRDRYVEIVQGLALSLPLDEEFRKIEESLTSAPDRDYTASRGEYLNGLVLAEYLGFTFLDAAELFFFDDAENFDAARSHGVLTARLEETPRAVVPGFYGIDPAGRVRTFPRGGSDITGAIIAGACGASVYENWTDVSGLLMADPRIVKDPKVIRDITYSELRELAYMGATVLHEDAILFVRRAGVPINIRNTNQPEDPGTWIVGHTAKQSSHTITGVTGKKDFCSIILAKDRLHSDPGFHSRVVRCFEESNVPLEHLPSGIDTMTVVVHASHFLDREQEVLARLARVARPDTLDIEPGLALIAVVGRGMKSRSGTAAKIFTALARVRVNVRMIDQGASELNVIVGVLNEDFERAIRSIYSAFVEEDSPD